MAALEKVQEDKLIQTHREGPIKLDDSFSIQFDPERDKQRSDSNGSLESLQTNPNINIEIDKDTNIKVSEKLKYLHGLISEKDKDPSHNKATNVIKESIDVMGYISSKIGSLDTVNIYNLSSYLAGLKPFYETYPGLMAQMTDLVTNHVDTLIDIYMQEEDHERKFITVNLLMTLYHNYGFLLKNSFNSSDQKQHQLIEDLLFYYNVDHFGDTQVQRWTSSMFRKLSGQNFSDVQQERDIAVKKPPVELYSRWLERISFAVENSYNINFDSLFTTTFEGIVVSDETKTLFLEFLNNNIDNFVKIIQNKPSIRNRVAITGLLHLIAAFGSEDKALVARDKLINLYDQSLDSEFRDENGEELDGIVYPTGDKPLTRRNGYILYSSMSTLENGTVQQMDELSTKLQDSFSQCQDNRPFITDCIINVVSSEKMDGDGDKPIKTVIRRLLDGMQVDPRLSSLVLKTPRENLKSIVELETIQPGICNALYSDFNISHFYRYSNDVLLKQFIRRNDKDRKHGLVMVASEDYEGERAAFASPGFRKAIDKAFENLDNVGYDFRIYEINSKLSLARMLMRCYHRYGTISCALLCGHGDEGRVQLGPYSEADYVRVEDEGWLSGLKNLSIFKQEEAEPASPTALRKGDLQKVNPKWKRLGLFEPNASIVLNSCSTGKKDYAKILAKLLNGTNVYAPMRDCRFQGLSISKTLAGVLRFKPIYDKGTKTRRYHYR